MTASVLPARTAAVVDTVRDRWIPRATYRLQLTSEFDFFAAIKAIPYLAKLGVSHLYLSPIFKARAGSRHGYDIVDHTAINPELGGDVGFYALSAAAKSHGMGLLLDVVPNHMAVASQENKWWLDVLEHGPASRYATYFDIDWTPIRESMRDRLLLAVLGDRYGAELQRGALKLFFDARVGAFGVRYADHAFPLDPKTYPTIFEAATGIVNSADAHELKALMQEFANLPTRSDRDASQVRASKSSALKTRLAALVKSNAVYSRCIDDALATINGVPNEPASFDALSELLDRQPYRLAFWKVAGDEINYRRFFDVNELAALRMDVREVFDATHGLLMKLIAGGHIHGLRIDHLDGLLEPHAYLATLRSALDRLPAPHCFVVVEKILAAHERLREWPIDGTTGYEFGAAIINWQSSERGLHQLEQLYQRFAHPPEYADTLYRSKKLLMRTALAAEIAVLTVQLDRIAQSHPITRDFTQYALRDALTEVIAAFPVYRTYVADDGPDIEDARIIKWEVGIARARDKSSDRSIFDFIQGVLLGDSVVASDATRDLVLDFAKKFQQVTAPVMAKSVEDTFFYRYCRLVALNEVGSDPAVGTMSTAGLHKENQERLRRFPHSLLASSTHDSKRGEDVRYRLSALTEVVSVWRRFVASASRLNRRARRRTNEGASPTRNDEYLLLQTIVGIWPTVPEDVDPQSLNARLKEYMIKAVREAKDRTSWLDPDQEYEAGLLEFIDSYFREPRWSAFLARVNEVTTRVGFFGLMNALSAIVLKATAPGVPDFYQGAELTALTLVDPDNRRPVDFSAREMLLEQLTDDSMRDGAAFVGELLRNWRTGELKMFINRRLLAIRSQHAEVFAFGGYEPLVVRGNQAEHLCAFARQHENHWLVVIVSRWTATLTNGDVVPPLGEKYWTDTYVELPIALGKSSSREPVLTETICDRLVNAHLVDGKPVMYLRDAFANLPVAVLFDQLSD